MKHARLLAAAAMTVAMLAACETPPPTPPTVKVSSQGWWQHGTAGVTDVPQTLPVSGVGGHLHIETAFPINQRIDGDINLDVHIMTHQGFAAEGDRLDVGIAPGGSTIAEVDLTAAQVAALQCGPKPAMCMVTIPIAVPASTLPAGPQSVRIRYLSADHSNGERQFTSNELRWFNRADPTGCLELEGKGWYIGMEYARAGIKSCLPSAPISGPYTFTRTARSTNHPITSTEVRIDARFGADDFGLLVDTSTPATSARSVTRAVTFDPVALELATGQHCLQVLTQVAEPGTDAVLTGVLEVPFTVTNPAGTRPGAGACL